VAWAQKLSIWGQAELDRGSDLKAANDDAEVLNPDCPWRFAGQYADDESGLFYNRFRYHDCDTGQYISPDPIGLRGGLNLYSYVPNPLKYIDPLGLCKSDITDKAAKWQGKGDYPGIDDWKIGGLKEGDIVYGGVPGQTEFYLSQSTLDAANGSKAALWESAQVKAHDIYGYRSQVQAYIVTQDTKVATSLVTANPHLGEGGATQYFIENYSDVLRPTGNPLGLD